MAQVDATGNVVSAPAPTLNLNTPPPDTQFLGGSVSQLPGYVPPDSGRVLQPWQVEDRNSYLQAQKMIAQQQAQRAAQDQLDAITQATAGNVGGPTQFEFSPTEQQLIALDPRLASVIRLGHVGIGAYNKATSVFPALQAWDAQQQVAQTGQPPSYLALQDLSQRSNPQDPRYARLHDLAVNNPAQYFAETNQQIPYQTPGVGIGGFFKPILNAATTEIPGAQRAGELLGQAAKIGYQAVAPQLPGANLLPNALQPANIVGKAAELAVPTQVWQAALELIPGIGSVPELTRAVREGLPDAIAALTRAGDQLGESDAVKNALGRFAEERGSVKLPGGGEPPVGPEGAPRPVGDNLPAPPESQPDLSSLGKGDQARIRAGGVGNALMVAQRYSADSVQRQAVIDVVMPQIAHLPETSQKLIVTGMETLPSKAARTTATEAQRAAQAARSAQAFEEAAGTPVERATSAFKAMGGKQPQRFTPFMQTGRFTDSEFVDLQNQIVQAFNDKRIGVFDRNNALSALNLLMTGERLPGVESEATKPLNLMPHEMKLLGNIFGPEVEAALPKTPAHMTGWLQRAVDLINMPRALVTALDVSAAGRQGILLSVRNPVEWGKSFGPMFQAMASEEGMARAGQNILRNPKYEDAIAHGLELTDLTTAGERQAAEEAFQWGGGVLQKIPGIRGSERGYVMFLDNLRMLTYEKYANRIERLAQRESWDAARTDLVKSQVARFVNHASGRGSLGFAGQYAPSLNAAFFSPRFFVSRPQSVWDLVRPGADPVSRQIVFENLAAFVGMGTGLLETARLAGAQVELDPRSSDFGKIRVGNHTIEFWGGFQPIARYTAQFLTASNKTLFTGKNQYTYPGQTVLRFFRSKLAPGGSLIYDYTVGGGKNYDGDTLFFADPKSIGLDRQTVNNAWNDFGQRLFPLSMQDAIKAYQQDGPLAAAGFAGASALGLGVASYAPSAAAQKTLAEQSFEKQTLAPAGAHIVGGQVYPDVLVSDWGSQAWQQEFAQDSPELGDLSGYKTYADLKKAYVDYWYKRNGDEPGLGERQTKADFGRAFDNQPASKLWAKNVQQETLNFWKRNPAALQQATQLGLNTLTQSERQLLPATNP